MNLKEDLNNKWALILGGSSGFGLATAKRCAEVGMNVVIVHRDRKGAMDKIEKEFDIVRSFGKKVLIFNCDALSQTDMEKVVYDLVKEGASIHLLMHSIAFGNLKGVIPGEEPYLGDEDFSRTIYSMGTSMLSWTQQLWLSKLLREGSQVIGMTSEGNEVAWKGYAAVSAAKVALEAVSRSIAVEFGRLGVRSNIIQAGVTDTPALRLIPGSDGMKEHAIKKNPLGRLTTPDDVAKFIVLMCSSWASWVNGELIRVDGGERISG